MITDNIITACEVMINQCQSIGMKTAMEMMLDMLMGFDDDTWMEMTTEEQRAWVREYMGEFWW